MKTTISKIADAQPCGRYAPTAIDAAKAAADFRIIDMSGNPTIRWRDGRQETITRRALKRLQSQHSWAPDF